MASLARTQSGNRQAPQLPYMISYRFLSFTYMLRVEKKRVQMIAELAITQSKLLRARTHMLVEQ